MPPPHAAISVSPPYPAARPFLATQVNSLLRFVANFRFTRRCILPQSGIGTAEVPRTGAFANRGQFEPPAEDEVPDLVLVRLLTGQRLTGVGLDSMQAARLIPAHLKFHSAASAGSMPWRSRALSPTSEEPAEPSCRTPTPCRTRRSRSYREGSSGSRCSTSSP